MKSKLIAVCVIAAVGMMLAVSAPAYAAITYDQNVTPDVIFGSGNTNGSFTTDQANGVELGLRAKIPYAGIIHSGGDGTYSYSLAELSAAHSSQRWNFDWTVNTDFSGASGFLIDDLTYTLGVDFDPSQGTSFSEFDPITPTTASPFFDHSIGTNSTANGGGAEAVDAAGYASLIAANNVLQQSWRLPWANPDSLPYDPTIDGTYDIFLAAFDGSTQLARTEIQVIIGAGGAAVPEPASLIIWSLLGVGCAGMAAVRRRRRAA